MNPRKLIRFVLSLKGMMVVTLVLIPMAVLIGRGCRQGEGPLSGPPSIDSTNGYGTEKFRGGSSPVRPDSKGLPLAGANVGTNETLPVLRIYGETNATAALPDFEFLPSGTLVPCCLVISVDSANIQTPIIAYVTEDVSHNGRVVIPANTMVHGRASGHLRNRISGEGSWTIIWQNGQELTIPGIALNHDPLPGEVTGPTDGTAGIEGEIIRSQPHAELKLFLTTMLAGMANAIQERQSTPLGFQVVPQMQNYALAGTGAVLDRYAQMVLQQIEKELYYVRASAGKRLYLYSTSPILRSKARAAGAIDPSDLGPAVASRGNPSHLSQ